jgi:hypothetical protein
MRTLVLAGWLVLSATFGQAQTVTPADLQGYAVDTRVVMDQRIRRDGRDINVQVHFRAQIAFEPDDVIRFEFSSISFGPRGSRQAPVQKGRALLGKVVEPKNLDGGQVVWVFADGALTTLRVFGNAGGFKRTISFTRTSDGAGGFDCKIEAAHLREDGVGRVATRSPVDNAPVTILSSKQVSSSCKVSKASGS